MRSMKKKVRGLGEKIDYMDREKFGKRASGC